MPFPSALSSPNQVTKRKGGSFARFLVVHTPSIQLQFRPSAAANANITAEIAFTSVLSGAYTSVLLGMTVIISPTSDYAADLRNQPENCFVTYVRLAATSTVLRIGQSKYQYTTSSYVTVLNDYRVFERKIRAISAFDVRRDWDILWRTPKPRIYNLYTTVVFAAPTTASVAFTPSAECMASSGSISSWLWNVGGGTITAGSTTTQNITVSFAVGTRYVHLTVTDSYGVSNYLTALIVVLPPALTSVIKLDNNAFSISKSLDSGNRGSFTALADGAWLDGSQAVVATYANYADGTTVLTTSLVAWLKDMSDSIRADEELGLIKETSVTMEGIAYYASQLQSEGFFTALKTTASAWGEFVRLSVYDALWYLLSEHSTLANVATIDYPSDYTDYKYPLINIPSGTMDEVASDLAFRCMGGTINYSPNGELVFRPSLLYLTDDSDRSAADTYASYTTEDIIGADYSRIINFEIKAVGQIRMGCSLFNTITTIPHVYFAKAPAGDESGHLIEELDSIILPADTSDDNAKILAGKFTANHFFAINENPTLQGRPLDGYHTIEPSAFQWHKFTIPSTETVTGAALSTNERFICTEFTIEYDDEKGALNVSATFRKETNGASNYLQDASYVATNTPNVKPFVPQYEAYPLLDTGIENEDIYDSGSGANDDSGGNGVQDPTLPPAQASQAQGQGRNVLETVYVPMFASTVIESLANLTNGADYILRVSGDGLLSQPRQTMTFDFALGAQLAWIPQVGGAGDRALWAGDGWTQVAQFGNEVLVIEVPFVWPANLIIRTVRYWIRNRIAAGFQYAFGTPYVTGTYPSGFFDTEGLAGGSYIDAGARTGMGIEHSVYATFDQKLYKVAFDYTGDPPPLGGVISDTGSLRGDAWYWKYNISDTQEYPTGTGTYIDGALPSPLPTYSAAHSYDIPYEGTGSPVQFQYLDSEAAYVDNDPVYLKVEIIAL